jgi:hypothetical protein
LGVMSFSLYSKPLLDIVILLHLKPLLDVESLFHPKPLLGVTSFSLYSKPLLDIVILLHLKPLLDVESFFIHVFRVVSVNLPQISNFQFLSNNFRRACLISCIIKKYM